MEACWWHPPKKQKKHGTFIMEPQKWVPEDDLPFQIWMIFRFHVKFSGEYTHFYIYVYLLSYMHHSCCKRWSMLVPKLLEDSRLENGDFPNEEWGWPFKYRPGKNSSDCLDMFRCWVKESNEAMSDLKLLWVWCKLASEYLSHTRVQQPPLQTGILLPRILMA